MISIVSMDPIDLVSQNWFDQAKELKITIQDLNQIEELGSRNPIRELPPKKGCIIYNFCLLRELQVVNQRELCYPKLVPLLILRH